MSVDTWKQIHNVRTCSYDMRSSRSHDKDFFPWWGRNIICVAQNTVILQFHIVDKSEVRTEVHCKSTGVMHSTLAIDKYCWLRRSFTSSDYHHLYTKVFLILLVLCACQTFCFDTPIIPFSLDATFTHDSSSKPKSGKVDHSLTKQHFASCADIPFKAACWAHSCLYTFYKRNEVRYTNTVI